MSALKCSSSTSAKPLVGTLINSVDGLKVTKIIIVKKSNTIEADKR